MNGVFINDYLSIDDLLTRLGYNNCAIGIMKSMEENFIIQSDHIDNSLHLPYSYENEHAKYINEIELIRHPYYKQVILDIVRCNIRVSNSFRRRNILKDLRILILEILHRYNSLQYYQGYHEIALNFVYLMDCEKGIKLFEKLTLTHLSFYMEPSLDSTIVAMNLVVNIIQCADLDLFLFIKKSEVEPVFALPWIITWFSHSLNSQQSVDLIFFVCSISHPLMPCYIASSVILLNKNQIMKTKCDMPSLHSKILSLLNDISYIDLFHIIKYAFKLFYYYPPGITFNMTRIVKKWEECLLKLLPNRIRYPGQHVHRKKRLFPNKINRKSIYINQKVTIGAGLLAMILVIGPIIYRSSINFSYMFSFFSRKILN